MTKLEKTIKTTDGFRKLVLFTDVTPSRRNNGSPPNIVAWFRKDGNTWKETGYLKNKETEREAVYRLYRKLKKEILGANKSPGLVTEAGWTYRDDIVKFFNEFEVKLKSRQTIKV